jgi:hypothetical protein
LNRRAILRLAADRVAADLGIPKSRYWLWDKVQSLTSIGATVAASHLTEIDAEEEEALRVSVRILNLDGRGSTRLSECQGSIVSVLSQHSLGLLRLYVLFLPGDPDRLTFEARLDTEMSALLAAN